MIQRVFLDASFWIAYRDSQESLHQEAQGILRELFRQETHFVTTLQVICEIHAYFARSRRIREQILSDLWNNPLLHIEEISHLDQKLAVEILRQQSDKSYSMCDALSFAVMRRLSVKRVLAFDDHFRQFGEFEIFS